MRINVSQQLKEPIGSTRNYRVDEIIDITGDGDSSVVQGDIGLVRTDRGILAKGTLCVTVNVTCSRCLRLFGCSLNLKVEDEYFPVAEVASGTPAPLPEESDGITIDKYHTLDLTEIIRQNALLALPIKPLCRQDCAGLCSECGHNLNQGSCGCPPVGTDPRWSKLSQLVSGGDMSAD